MWRMGEGERKSTMTLVAEESNITTKFEDLQTFFLKQPSSSAVLNHAHACFYQIITLSQHPTPLQAHLLHYPLCGILNAGPDYHCISYGNIVQFIFSFFLLRIDFGGRMGRLYC